MNNTFQDSWPLMGQDPFVLRYKGKLLLCESQEEERIALSVLTNRGRQGTKIIWDKDGEHQLWSPELHFVDSKWFIYYSSSDGDNKNHRMKVLGAATDPFSPYGFSETLDEDSWGIDQTTFLWEGKRYAAWSGWGDTREEFPQNLYISTMVSPVKLGERILLSSPEYDWERSIAAINEGPQAFVENGRLFLLYSANASWMPEYSTGMLELIGVNPLNPWHWVKYPKPLMQNAGHGMILGNDFWYHRKLSNFAGWQDREIVKVTKEELLNGKKGKV